MKTQTFDKTHKVIATLNTKAISKCEGIIYKYNVNVCKENNKLILSIENTPASWYISTLKEYGYSNKISIDGYHWICINFDEIMNEFNNLNL